MTDAESELYGGTREARLAALRRLCAGAPPKERRGTNLHIHTNESFSVFRSPTEAVWQAVQEALAVFGINDHYTVAGHREFRQACEIANLPATFSLETVAMNEDARTNRVLTNDPGNPGRTYLCGKGVTRVPPDWSDAMKNLARMRAALDRRHRAMTEKLGRLVDERMGSPGPSWDDVVGLTPRGNVTERHIAEAAYLWLRAFAEDRGLPLVDAVARCCDAPPAAAGAAALQNHIRSTLLKAGRPCFVEESPDAFLAMDEMRDLFLAFGAIPTYPVLGDPVTEYEEDVEGLMDRLAEMRIYALEVIPHRNSRRRLSAIVKAAAARRWPVFNGTEHNTPEPMPLLAPISLHPDFRPWFERSAAVLLGHQYLVRENQPGFVNEEGVPLIRDARRRFEHCADAGRVVWDAIERTAEGGG
ncbi:MAG: hypothetical protein R6V58_06995 [Planctomycetota bacterium]